MDGQAVFAELKTILADLYLAPADAQRIAAEAGLDLAQISFDAKAINNWHNLLVEAIQADALDLLLATVLGEYPQHQALVRSAETYRHFIATGGQLNAPPTLAGHNIVVNQGDFVAGNKVVQGDEVQGGFCKNPHFVHDITWEFN